MKGGEFMLVAQRPRGAETTFEDDTRQRRSMRGGPAGGCAPESAAIRSPLRAAFLALPLMLIAGGHASASEFGPEFASASASAPGLLAPAPQMRGAQGFQPIAPRQASAGYASLGPRGSEGKALEKPVALRGSFISETRFGLLAQDPWSPEAQTGALHGEVLFARPFQPSDPLMRYFTPQPHIGASFNLGSRTSFVFAGLTWNIDLSPRVFVEASFGGALHDGHRGGVVREDRAALGCSPLFRESASLGYRFSERLSFMATVEHYGNAGLCSENRGLTNIGARFGYSF